MAARLGNALYRFGIVVAVLCLLATGPWIVFTDINRNDARLTLQEARMAVAEGEIRRDIDELEQKTSAENVDRLKREAASLLQDALKSVDTAERRYQERWVIGAKLVLFGLFVFGVGWTARYILRRPS